MRKKNIIRWELIIIQPLLWLLIAALMAADSPSKAPQKILDLLAKVEASRAAVAAADRAIVADRARLDEDLKLRQDALKAMAEDRAAFRAAWQELYGDVDDLIPNPQPPNPAPPIPKPEPQPPTPAPEVKYTAYLALVLENPDQRTPAQAAVNEWMAVNLRKADGESNYLWYDSRDTNIPINVRGYLEDPVPPKLVIFGKEPSKSKFTVLYNGPRPDTVEAFKKLWTMKGGSL